MTIEPRPARTAPCLPMSGRPRRQPPRGHPQLRQQTRRVELHSVDDPPRTRRLRNEATAGDEVTAGDDDDAA